ncbi:MAG TPA: endo-1,4-beta-xylanase [Chitinispirillaceae bacterium]|nr:endo-1,4-beta-xylanase [Chitinispirillaceae bacterium]
MGTIRSRVGLLGSILFVFSLSTFSQETLRACADKIGLNIGSCTFYNAYSSDQTYSSVLKRDFNTIVAENEMKASSLHPSRGQFTFSRADDMVKFAENNKMKMRGHVLVWHAQNPSWLQSGSWTRETLLEAMKEHINGVLGHFKGKNKTVFEWDVVNEAFHNDASKGTLRSSFWKNVIGEDFIDSAFAFAHRADPEVLLFYNDYNTSNITTKSTAIYNKIKKMIDNGIPIHGVGFQSHQTLEEYTPAFIESLKENFDRFAKLGLKISVTELDIRITLPTEQSELEKQADFYHEFLETAIANPACRTFMIWGFTDKHSWVPGTFKGTGDALIYSNTYQPKPAYAEMLDVLKNFKEAGIEQPINSRMLNNPALSLVGSNGYSCLFNLQGKKVGSVMVISNPSVIPRPINLANQMTFSTATKHGSVQVK